MRRAFVSAAAALALVGCGAASDAVPSADGRISLEQAAAFDEYPLVFAGERADGLPLVAVLHRDDTARYVSFVYGECVPAPAGEGCAPPAEIQVWPRERRPPELYDGVSPGSPAPERTSVRGAAAAFFEAGRRLEIFTQASTVVIFGDSRARVLAIAEDLRCVRSGGRGLPTTSLDC
jgi:hypothetical protein